jgi:hypothetical protein
MIVFAIAAAPAVVVAVVAASTESRAATLAAALVAAAIGVITGNPAYIGLDIAFVALALWLSWPQVDPAKIRAASAKRAAQKAYFESPEFKRKEQLWGGVFAVVLVGGFFLYQKWPTIMAERPGTEIPNTNVSMVKTQTTTVSPSITPPSIASSSSPVVAKAPQSSGPRRLGKSPFQKCVEIIEEKKMQVCLEALK